METVVQLNPVDVELSLTSDLNLNIFQVIDVAEVWLFDGMEEYLTLQGFTSAQNYSYLERISLDKRDAERMANGTDGSFLYTAPLRGYARFIGSADESRTVPIMTVMDAQRVTFETKAQEFMEALQADDPSRLGEGLLGINSTLLPYELPSAAPSTVPSAAPSTVPSTVPTTMPSNPPKGRALPSDSPTVAPNSDGFMVHSGFSVGVLWAVAAIMTLKFLG